MMLERFHRLFRYEQWANQEALASVAATPRALRLLAHVLGAQRLWLDRLRGQPPSAPVWPEWDAAACGAEADDLPRAWSAYLGGLGEERLDEQVAYVNSKGEPWRSRVEDVLMHVLLHSAYHRGQAAAAVRADGGAPAYTDFIHAVRSGFVA
jgi:uncharacterized damage-inducible protein DinB